MRRLRPVVATLGKVAVLSLAAVAAFSCDGKSSTTPTGPSNTPTPPTLSSVSISGSTSFTELGQTSQLSAIASFSNGTTENVSTTAVWQTSNAAVAVVSGSGLLTARGLGSAEVTAAYQSQTGRANVTVAGPACSIALSETAVTFERSGGSRSVNVQTSAASCTWQAISNASWLRITAGASGVGNGVASYLVDAHTGTSTREGTIGIGGQTLTVRQTPDARCRYCPSPTSRTVPSVGGTFSLSVDPVTNTDGTPIDWNATADQPWLRVTSGQTGRGRGTVTYVVDRNTSAATKTGMISVGGPSGIFPRETHVVTQQP